MIVPNNELRCLGPYLHAIPVLFRVLIIEHITQRTPNIHIINTNLVARNKLPAILEPALQPPKPKQAVLLEVPPHLLQHCLFVVVCEGVLVDVVHPRHQILVREEREGLGLGALEGVRGRQGVGAADVVEDCVGLD